MRVRFALDNLAQVSFVHTERPFATVLLHLADHCGYPVGLPRPWRVTTRRAIGPNLESLALLRYVAPYPLVEDTAERPLTLARRLRELRELARDGVVDEQNVAEIGELVTQGQLPRHLLRTIERPVNFVRTAVACATRTATITAEFWPAAAYHLERAERRVLAAQSVTAKETLVASLVAGNRIEDGIVVGQHPDGPIARFAPRVELFPMLVGPHASMLLSDLDAQGRLEIHGVGYSLPGFESLVDRAGHARPSHPLDVLLGSIRADMLRALEKETGMGELARTVHTSPSRATYHVDFLESAGLVQRRRRGTSVQVGRTARGDGLLDLMVQP